MQMNRTIEILVRDAWHGRLSNRNRAAARNALDLSFGRERLSSTQVQGRTGENGPVTDPCEEGRSKRPGRGHAPASTPALPSAIKVDQPHTGIGLAGGLAQSSPEPEE